DLQALSPYDNLASRRRNRIVQNWRAAAELGTWPLWLVADEFRYSDRRRMSQVEVGREEFIRFTSALTAMPSAKVSASLLATRGERRSLLRIFVEIASDDVGPSEIEHLHVVEANDAGHPVAVIRFDMDDLE